MTEKTVSLLRRIHPRLRFLRSILTVGAISMMLLTSLLAGQPSLACSGCDSSYHCIYGLEQGGYGCNEGDGHCSLIGKIVFGCDGRYCTTSGICDNRIAPSGPPQPKPVTNSVEAAFDGWGSPLEASVCGVSQTPAMEWAE